MPPHQPPDPVAAPVAPALSGLAGMLAGALAMVFVGGSVAVSGVLSGSPLFTAQAVRYTAACLLLLAAARLTGQRLVLPRGAEWAWLLGVAATGLVVFNLALVEGSRHAEPAVFGVAVACVPLVLAVVAPLMDGGRPRPAVLLAALVVTCGAALVQGVGRSDLVGLAWAAVVLAWRPASPCSRCRCCAGTGRGGCRSTRPGWPPSSSPVPAWSTRGRPRGRG